MKHRNTPRDKMFLYDQTAHIYNHRYREIQEEKYRSILRRVTFGRADLILDAGCGTGMLLEKIPKEHAVGVDFSREMIKRAKNKNKSSNLVRADLSNLPFKDNTFDCIVFDPPYQDRWRFNLEKVKRPGRLYLENPYMLSEGYECFTPQQLELVKTEFYRVLRTQGILIMKLADHRSRNIWWQPEVFKRMDDLFEILDIIIYVRPKGSMLPPVYFIQRNRRSTLVHAYFFILKKREVED